MKPLPTVIAALAGLVAGALVGSNDATFRSGAGGFARREQSVHATPPAGSSQPATPLRDEDAPVVKLFTALRDPLVLRRRFAISQVLEHLSAKDLPDLIARAEALPEELAAQLLPALVRRWFELDFEAAQAWLRVNRLWLLSVGSAVGKADPEKAIRAAQETPGEWNVMESIVAAVRELAGDSAAAQIARLKTLPAGMLRDRGIGMILGKLAEKDPAAAFGFLHEIGSDGEPGELRQHILAKWAERDPEAALAQLNTLIPSLKAGAYGNRLVIGVAEGIAAKEPQLILDWLTTIPPEFLATAGVAAARVWARQQPVAALDWCLGAGVDPARAYRGEWYAVESSVLGEAMTKAPRETIAWLEALPVGADRDRLFERALLDGLSRAPTQKFASEADTLMALYAQLPEDAQIRSARRLGETRAAQGGVTNLSAWAQPFAAGPARATAIAGAMSGAYQHDASRVESLLASVHTAADRDAALRGLSVAMSIRRPAEAAERALTIQDQVTRQETLEAVIVPWLEREAAAGQEWLRSEAAQFPQAWKLAWLQPK